MELGLHYQDSLHTEEENEWVFLNNFLEVRAEQWGEPESVDLLLWGSAPERQQWRACVLCPSRLWTEPLRASCAVFCGVQTCHSYLSVPTFREPEPEMVWPFVCAGTKAGGTCCHVGLQSARVWLWRPDREDLAFQDKSVAYKEVVSGTTQLNPQLPTVNDISNCSLLNSSLAIHSTV